MNSSIPDGYERLGKDLVWGAVGKASCQIMSENRCVKTVRDLELEL